jgi:hypothetical protein
VQPIHDWQCDKISIPSLLRGTILTTTTTSAGYVYVDEVEPSVWSSPNDWGAVQWIVVVVAPMIFLFVGCKAIWMLHEQKARHQKIYVASDGKEKTNWDFSEAGTLAVDEIIETDEALAKASPGSERMLIFSEGNRLKAQHLQRLGDTLNHHATVKVRLGSDWLGATDETIEALAHLLRVHSRSEVRGTVLRMRFDCSARAAFLLGESLAGHSEVDAVLFRPKDAGKEVLEDFGADKKAGLPPDAIPLWHMRYGQDDVDFSKQNSFGDAGAAMICGFVKRRAGRLRAFRLRDCQVRDEGAASVVNLAIQHGSRLQELSLSYNLLGDRSATSLALALQSCRSLERLCLDRNHIGAKGAVALAEGLKGSSLRELILGTHLGGNPLKPDGAAAFAKVLQDSTTYLRCLALDACNLGPWGAKALAEALPSSGSLEELSLSNNAIADEGGFHFAEHIANSVVTSLGLGENGIGDAAAEALANCLHEAPQLTLSLEQNKLTGGLKSRLIEEHGHRIQI